MSALCKTHLGVANRSALRIIVTLRLLSRRDIGLVANVPAQVGVTSDRFIKRLMEDGLRGFVPLGRERAVRRPVGELQDEDVRVFARARHLVERRICDERLPLHHLVEDLK